MQPSKDIENKRNTLNTALISIFWASVAIFILFILSTMILPLILGALSIQPTIPVINFFPFLGGIFFLLGIAIIVLTIKAKLKGLINKFLLLTGASITGILVFALLHNLVSAVFVNFFGGEEPFFFILAVIICPIGFLVGMIGTIVLYVRKKKLIREN